MIFVCDCHIIRTAYDAKAILIAIAVSVKLWKLVRVLIYKYCSFVWFVLRLLFSFQL